MPHDEQFSFVFKRMMDGWREVWGFREASALGLQAGLPQLIGLKEQSLAIIEGRPDFRRIVKNPEEFSKSKGKLAFRTAKMSTESAMTAVDSASLIFMHSILDGAATGFLRTVAAVDPSGWECFLDEKKFTVADIRVRGYNALYQELLAAELDHIERSFSLPKKANRLHHFCRPEKDWGLWPYDRDELCRIDQLRHDIVHGDKLGQPILSIEKDLEFMQNAAEYFLSMVHKRYGLKIIWFEEGWVESGDNSTGL